MTHLLETFSLTRDFGTFRAVDSVNLRVQQGTLHSLIGPNGAGKTTLFNCISAVLPPTHGRVHYEGRDITGTPLHRMTALGIGRSFQITNVFGNVSVLENVRLAVQARHARASYQFWRRADDLSEFEDRAMHALKLVGLAGRERQLAVMLPHGDKRKLELAILLAGDPKLLLLDEPTAGMATEQVPELMATIEHIRANGNRTIILVEHNMNVVMRFSNRISVLHQGRILAEGTPDEIRANDAVQKAYLGGGF
ncbi:MAG: ABC transporter ATP-binding protein [Anaerolineae bacterium]|nr:ABC transporter ATP-binding protein [Anaerolineae bacterium]